MHWLYHPFSSLEKGVEFVQTTSNSVHCKSQEHGNMQTFKSLKIWIFTLVFLYGQIHLPLTLQNVRFEMSEYSNTTIS